MPTMSDRNSRTKPNCARCRNHGVKVPLKDHKRFCKLKLCKCDKCLLTVTRQKVMAEQTRVRRAEDLERKLAREGLPVPERILTPPTSPSTLADDFSDSLSLSSVSSAPRAASRTPRRMPSPPPPPSSQHQQNIAEMWQSIITVTELSKLPLHIYPLVYIILTKITPNIQEVLDRLRAATEMWHSIHQLLERYKIPGTAIPLLSIILSEVTPNAEAISRLIESAGEELRKVNLLDESLETSLHQPLTMEHPLLFSHPPPFLSSMLHDVQHSAFVPVHPLILVPHASSGFPVHRNLRTQSMQRLDNRTSYDQPASPSSECSSLSSRSGSEN